MSKPWKQLGCCKACYFAKGRKCQCSCGGRYHGMGLIKNPSSEDEFKVLVNMKPLNEVVAEKLCRTLEEALSKHPEWEKHLETVEDEQESR